MINPDGFFFFFDIVSNDVSSSSLTLFAGVVFSLFLPPGSSIELFKLTNLVFEQDTKLTPRSTISLSS